MNKSQIVIIFCWISALAVTFIFNDKTAAQSFIAASFVIIALRKSQ